MNERVKLGVIAVILLGAAALSAMDGVNLTFKTIFYGVGMGILLLIGLVSFVQFIKRGREARKQEKLAKQAKKKKKKKKKK